MSIREDMLSLLLDASAPRIYGGTQNGLLNMLWDGEGGEKNVIRFILTKFAWVPNAAETNCESWYVGRYRNTYVRRVYRATDECFGFMIFVDGVHIGSVIQGTNIYQNVLYTSLDDLKAGRFNIRGWGVASPISQSGQFLTGRTCSTEEYNEDGEFVSRINITEQKAFFWQMGMRKLSDRKYIDYTIHAHARKITTYADGTETDEDASYLAPVGDAGAAIIIRNDFPVDGSTYGSLENSLPPFVYAFDGLDYAGYMEFINDLYLGDKYKGYTTFYDIDDNIRYEE